MSHKVRVLFDSLVDVLLVLVDAGCYLKLENDVHKNHAWLGARIKSLNTMLCAHSCSRLVYVSQLSPFALCSKHTSGVCAYALCAQIIREHGLDGNQATCFRRFVYKKFVFVSKFCRRNNLWGQTYEHHSIQHSQVLSALTIYLCICASDKTQTLTL